MLYIFLWDRGMMNRRKYYDIFSHFYDFIIRLHSRDETGRARSFLSEKVGTDRGRMLDICTGTGDVAIELAKSFDAPVVGIDFSKGMVKKAVQKRGGIKNLHFLIADVSELPFRENIFSGISCSHAFYEIKGEKKRETLKEIRRILEIGGRFCMMEHDIPKNPVIKLLFYIRLMSMGKKEALVFLKEEMDIFREYFIEVEKENTASGKSKLISGKKR